MDEELTPYSLLLKVRYAYYLILYKSINIADKCLFDGYTKA